MEPWGGGGEVLRKNTHHSLLKSLHLVCFDYQPIGRQKPIVNDNQLDPLRTKWIPSNPGALPYKSAGDVHRRIQIKPLKTTRSNRLKFRLPLFPTNVGVAQANTNPGPKGDFCVVSVRAFFVNFFIHSTK